MSGPYSAGANRAPDGDEEMDPAFAAVLADMSRQATHWRTFYDLENFRDRGFSHDLLSMGRVRPDQPLEPFREQHDRVEAYLARLCGQAEGLMARDGFDGAKRFQVLTRYGIDYVMNPQPSDDPLLAPARRRYLSIIEEMRGGVDSLAGDNQTIRVLLALSVAPSFLSLVEYGIRGASAAIEQRASHDVLHRNAVAMLDDFGQAFGLTGESVSLIDLMNTAVYLGPRSLPEAETPQN